MTSSRTHTYTDTAPVGRTEADAVAAVAAKAAEVRRLDAPGLAAGVLVLDVGPGRQVQVHDLERHLDRPRRRTGHVRVSTPAALAEYVTEHAGVESHSGATLWGDRVAGVVVAVLDDHTGPGLDGDQPAAGWGEHRATLTLRHTPEWTHWTRQDGQLLAQAAFAEWVEDGISAVVAPPAAELLEACRTLNITRDVTFSSVDRPASGEMRIAYQEVDTARAGDVELPEQITLRLAPWEGCEPRELTARLRYRLTQGKLTLGYRLVCPDELLRAAWDHIVGGINNDTGIYVYAGTPRG